MPKPPLTPLILSALIVAAVIATAALLKAGMLTRNPCSVPEESAGGDLLGYYMDFSISAGYVKPGSQIGVTVYDVRDDFNGKIILCIYKVSPLGEILVYKSEAAAERLPGSIKWTIPPGSEPAKYRLLLLLAIDGSIVDYMDSVVIVPEQKVEAKMTTDKTVYRVGETIKLTITNLGDTPVGVGRPYEVYYWNGSAWVFSDELTPDIWTLELILLEKGESFTQEISLEKAVPGKYKVVKRVFGEGTDIAVELEVEFEVRG